MRNPIGCGQLVDFALTQAQDFCDFSHRECGFSLFQQFDHWIPSIHDRKQQLVGVHWERRGTQRLSAQREDTTPGSAGLSPGPKLVHYGPGQLCNKLLRD